MQRAAELQDRESDIGEGLTPEEVLALGKEVGTPRLSPAGDARGAFPHRSGPGPRFSRSRGRTAVRTAQRVKCGERRKTGQRQSRSPLDRRQRAVHHPAAATGTRSPEPLRGIGWRSASRPPCRGGTKRPSCCPGARSTRPSPRWSRVLSRLIQRGSSPPSAGAFLGGWAGGAQWGTAYSPPGILAIMTAVLVDRLD